MRGERTLTKRPSARPLGGRAGSCPSPLARGGDTGNQTLQGVEDIILKGDGTSGILMGDGVSYIRMGF